MGKKTSVIPRSNTEWFSIGANQRIRRTSSRARRGAARLRRVASDRRAYSRYKRPCTSSRGIRPFPGPADPRSRRTRRRARSPDRARADGFLRFSSLPEEDRLRPAFAFVLHRLALREDRDRYLGGPVYRAMGVSSPVGSESGRWPGTGTTARASRGTRGWHRTGMSASGASAQSRSAGTIRPTCPRRTRIDGTTGAVMGYNSRGTATRPDDRASRDPVQERRAGLSAVGIGHALMRCDRRLSRPFHGSHPSLVTRVFVLIMERRRRKHLATRLQSR